MLTPFKTKLDRDVIQALQQQRAQVVGIDAFEHQAPQYPQKGEPDTVFYFAAAEDDPTLFGAVHCLLYYDADGDLRGILNYYSENVPRGHRPPLEKAGNFNIWVQAGHRRQGYGTRLMIEAMERWEINFLQQLYTRDGILFVRALVESLVLGSEVRLECDE